jgi:hypothetical protein
MRLSLDLGLGSVATLNAGGGVPPVTERGLIAIRPTTEDNAGIAIYDEWAEQPADLIFTFNGWTNWTAYTTSVDNLRAKYAGDTRPIIWTIGLNVTGTTLAEAAAGDFDAYYLSVAEKMLAGATWDGHIHVRLAHEFNIPGNYPWEAVNSGHEAEFITAWRRFVDICRGVSDRFRFCWNPNWTSVTTPQYDSALCWPGNGYVDVVGTDLYYDSENDDELPQVHYNYAKTLSPNGLDWIAAFARSKGKPLALCEFGTDWDRPGFIDLMAGWCRDNNVVWAGYFDCTTSLHWQISDDSKPDCGRRFLIDFRDKGAIPALGPWTFEWNSEGFTGVNTGSFSRVDGVAQVTGVSNFAGGAVRTVTGLTIGQAYRIDLDLHTGNKNARVLVRENSAPQALLASPTFNNNTFERKSVTFTATQTAIMLMVQPYAGDGAQVVQFDTIEFYKV